VQPASPTEAVEPLQEENVRTSARVAFGGRNKSNRGDSRLDNYRTVIGYRDYDIDGTFFLLLLQLDTKK
jgi:hypothetical protein